MVESALKMPCSAPFTNHARISVPAPKPTKYLRARQFHSASTGMPTMSDDGNEIFNLFPLTKLPPDLVMEGLFSAVFERSGRGTGVMYSDSNPRRYWGFFRERTKLLRTR
eukprot:GILI01033321.1.p1 GENE.GILI01033321.1~~GILI01033321.1.p1  ORF type:complete len:110 (+),score=1.22 GILI01033321.1:252-581(+)